MTAPAQLSLLPESGLPVLDRRFRGATFVGLPARSVLNSPASTGMKFWSVNPYVGCEFGCGYCYARDTHRWVVERAAARSDAATLPVLGELTELPPQDAFEQRIFVKTEAAALLRRTLRSAPIGDTPIVIGTATDPYQPAERRFGLTRRLLETLLEHRGLTLGIITKSTLVARDRALLQRLAERHELKVHLSLASTDPVLLRRLEPRTPLPHARLRALRALTEVGIPAGVMLAPILPGLTDSWSSLAAVFEASRGAGARFVSWAALRLGPAARTRFLALLRREFPALAPRYERHYADRNNTSRAYQRALGRRVRLLKEAFGFEGR